MVCQVKLIPFTGNLPWGVHVYCGALRDAGLTAEGDLLVEAREIRLIGEVRRWLDAPWYQELDCVPIWFHVATKKFDLMNPEPVYQTPAELRPVIERFRSQWREKAGPEGATVITLKGH